MLLAVALVVACGDDGGGGSGGGSAGGTGTTGALTTGTTGSSSSGDYMPDDDPCPAKTCPIDVSQCCTTKQPISGSTAPACPGAYPNNWTCDDGVCVLGGCSSAADCVVAGLTCAQVGGVGRCVELCGGSDEYCTVVTNSPGTRCIGLTDANQTYCVEDVNP